MDWRILYNPLAALGKGKGVTAGILVIIVLTAVAWWGGVHLDGALDVHVTPKPPSATLAIAESLTAWLSLGILLLVASKMFGGNGGAGEHLAAVGLARFPYILIAIVGSRHLLGKAMLAAVSLKKEKIIVNPAALVTPGVVIGTFAILAFIIWAMVMLYAGYKQASRLEGGKAAGSFIIGLILAEGISLLIVRVGFRAGF